MIIETPSFVCTCDFLTRLLHIQRHSRSKVTEINSFAYERHAWSLCVRTNNDIEGWHHGLNRRAAVKSDVPFYLQLQLLHRETRLTRLQMKLVSERKLKRIQRRKCRALQSSRSIFNLWEEFENGERNVRQLSSAISHLNGPNQ